MEDGFHDLGHGVMSVGEVDSITFLDSGCNKSLQLGADDSRIAELAYRSAE